MTGSIAPSSTSRVTGKDGVSSDARSIEMGSAEANQNIVEPAPEVAIMPSAAEKDEMPGDDLQRGVQDVEAVTIAWTRNMLIAAFINMWMLYFVNAMQSTILAALIPYVASSFNKHSELNIIYVVGDAFSAAIFIPLAKVMDTWGRAQGFLVMSIFCTLGLVLMAVCNSLGVFCAAYVFYTIGFSGITYCVDVITADASTLKNRGLAYAFTSSPYIISAFAGAKAANAFYEHVSWRWAFGSFAVIFPVVAAPLYLILTINLRKASRQGYLAREKSGRTLVQSIRHYTFEFDVIGVLLFSTGLTVFLLPFDIATSAPSGWSTGYIIAMFVVGFVLLASFGVYETYFAPTPMLNFGFISNKTVIGACLLDFFYQISYYCWDNYFTSFLQVVNDLTISEANYVNNTFDVVGGILCLISGYLIRKTGRYKWQLYITIPLYIWWQGMMIYFRDANQSVGYLVMCQIFISIGGSAFIIVEQVAILAAVDHAHVAAVLALLNVVGTVGDALGATVSGIIWTNTFKKSLVRNLPELASPRIEKIYEGLEVQLSYAPGSAVRLGIQRAYAYAQTRMLATGTAVMVVPLLSLFLIKNIRVDVIKQVKGVVW